MSANSSLNRPRHLLWDPDKESDRFIVSSPSDVRLYEAVQGPRTQFKTLAACSELGQIRSVAWGTHPNRGSDAPLVAAGLNTGRTLLFRLEQYATDDVAQNALQINVRHTRPCNVVTFSRDDPHWLAVGLERGRGESLLVFDSEARGIAQLGSSESVVAAAFVSRLSSLPLLAASLSLKHLRLYDIRDATTTNSIQLGTPTSTRAVLGIEPDPFCAFQLATFSDDSIVKVWDVRRSDTPVITLSDSRAGTRNALYEAELAELSESGFGYYTTSGSSGANTSAISLSAEMAPSTPSSVLQIQFSETERGALSVADRDGRFVRQWSLLSSDREPTLVLDDRRSSSFSHSVSSFSHMSSRFDGAVLGVARDTTSIGSSGHRLEVVHFSRRERASVTDGVVVLASSSVEGEPQRHEKEKKSARTNGTKDVLEEDKIESSDTEEHEHQGVTGDHLESPVEDNRKDATSSRETTPESDLYSKKQTLHLFDLPPDTDIRARINLGYGPSAKINASLPDGPHPAFWRWILRNHVLSRKDNVASQYDFRFRGILDLIRGFPPSSSQGAESELIRLAQSPEHLRRAYVAAARTLSEKRGVKTSGSEGGPLAVLRSLRGSEDTSIGILRALALQTCGKEWEGHAQSVRHENQGNFEAAARHSFFTGDLHRCATNLKRCEDDKLCMLGALLLLFCQSASEATRTLVKTLDSEDNSPWIRALISFILAKGDWKYVVSEKRLGIVERAVVALEFLPDDALLSFLAEAEDEFSGSENLDAVVFFGLRGPNALSLLQAFLDSTSDIHTVALAATYVYPGVLTDAQEKAAVQRWIYTYRKLLDNMKLYIPRVMFDMEHGKRAKKSVPTTPTTDYTGVPVLSSIHTPPQIVIRCQFCGIVVSGSRPFSGNELAEIGHGLTKASPNACPNCSKQLPACSVCLRRVDGLATRARHDSLEVNQAEESLLASALTWCQKCRHGGHLAHILEWFDRNTECPVADCTCECRNG